MCSSSFLHCCLHASLLFFRKVGLSISGEAFRHMVMVEVPLDDVSPLNVDRFEVDAFSLDKRKRKFAGCFVRKRIDSSDDFEDRCIWDRKPRLMSTLEFVLRYVQIFSRMSPDDKALLIQQLQSLPNAPIVVR